MSRLASYRGLGAPQQLVENLSTASTALTLTDDQQNKLLVWNGQSSAARINLPAPEVGMQYHIFFGDDAVSSATKICSSAYEIYFSNIDLVQTTAGAVSLGSTLEGGGYVQLMAVSDVRWAAIQFGNPSTVNNAGLNSTTT